MSQFCINGEDYVSGAARELGARTMNVPLEGAFPTCGHVWLCRIRDQGLTVLPRASEHSARRRLNLCQMGQIALTLLRPPVVTRLILRTHQAVGTAATVGHQVQVAAAPPD